MCSTREAGVIPVIPSHNSALLMACALFLIEFIVFCACGSVGKDLRSWM